MTTQKKLSAKRFAEKELKRALDKIAVVKAKRTDGIAYFLEHCIKRAYGGDTSMSQALLRAILPKEPLIQETQNVLNQYASIKLVIDDKVRKTPRTLAEDRMAGTGTVPRDALYIGEEDGDTGTGTDTGTTNTGEDAPS